MLENTNAVRNGIILFILLGLYFLLLDALGYADNIFFRLGNYVFVFLFVNNSIKTAAKKGDNYLTKLAVGIVTVFIGMSLGAISLFIYLQVLEPSLERYISPVITANSYTRLCIALFVQSLASSMVLVFIVSQLYKNKRPEEIK